MRAVLVDHGDDDGKYFFQRYYDDAALERLGFGEMSKPVFDFSAPEENRDEQR